MEQFNNALCIFSSGIYPKGNIIFVAYVKHIIVGKEEYALSSVAWVASSLPVK